MNNLLLCASNTDLVIILSLCAALLVIAILFVIFAVKAKRRDDKEIQCFLQDDCDFCKFKNKCSETEKSYKYDRKNLSLDPKTEPKREEKELGSDKCVDIVHYKGYKVKVYFDDYGQSYYFKFCDHHGDEHEASCGSFNSCYKDSIEDYIDTVFEDYSK